MNNKGPTQITTDPIEPNPKDVNFYINPKNGSLEKITIKSNNDETELFPITLEFGDEYIPDFGEFETSLLSEGENTSHLIDTRSFEIMERNLFHSVKDFDFEVGFLQFAKENLSIGYERAVIEQTAVRQHLSETDLLRRLPDEIYFRDCNRLFMRWPYYYPGKDVYGLDLLPTSKELYPAYLLNKLVTIYNNRERYNPKEEMFDRDEILSIKAFITENLSESKPDDIFEKIIEYHDLSYNDINNMHDNYLEKWDEIFSLEERIKALLNDLGNID